MRGAKLRHRISVQTKTTTRTDDGGYSEGYAHSFYTRASILGLMGKEFFESAQLQSTISHKIRVRYDSSTSTIKPDDLIVWDSRDFNITSAVPDERNKEIVIMATEVLS